MSVHKALITGATSGIGEALAKLLSSKGVKLILAGRNQEKLQQIASVTSAEKVIIADLKEKKGRVDIISTIQLDLPDLVINNAGFGVYGEVLSTSFDEQEAVADVDAMAPLEITIETARALIAAKKKGVIVNVSSVAGEYPTPGMAVYGASKAFLTQFSRAFHEEVRKKGVDVLVTAPGMVATDFSNRAARKKVSQKGHVMSAEFAANEIWKQIQKKKPKWVIDRYYRWSSLFAKRFVPESFVMKLIWNRINERL